MTRYVMVPVVYEVTDGPGTGWEISEETRREIEDLEDYMRWSAVAANGRMVD